MARFTRLTVFYYAGTEVAREVAAAHIAGGADCWSSPVAATHAWEVLATPAIPDMINKIREGE